MKKLLLFLAIGALVLPALFSCGGTLDEKVPVSSLELSQTSLDLMEGDEATLTATVKPSDATEKSVSWRSSDESVATVNNGRVKAVKPGNATITASAGGRSATCSVKVGKRVVAVTSVSLDKTELKLKVGEEATLTATVKPDDATDKTVTWSSLDPKVATVQNGKVTALKAGVVVIMANAGEKGAMCNVTVEDNVVAVTSVELDKTTLEMTEGDETTLTATVKPDNATDKTVTWTTSDATVATVTDGKVKALKAGSVTITATAGEKSAKCTVNVSTKVIPVTSMWLDKSELELTEGDETTLTATVMPENATDKTVTWSSSNTSVATVTDGKVKAVKAGTATITAKAGEKSAKCTVTVLPSFIVVTSIELDKTTLSLVEGTQAALTATVSPDNATDPTVTWTTSNAAVATVEDGMVTAVKAGTATITAKAGEKTAKCTVTVTAAFVPVTSVTLNKTALEMVEGDEAALTATVKPDNATEPAVTWTSSDESVATVADGQVKALKAGTATITAKAGEKSATCAVNVQAKVIPVTSITLDMTTVTLSEGEYTRLTPTVKPDDATDKTVTWSSSDPSVARVEDGMVYAVKVGTAVITAKAGEKSAKCTVTVTLPYVLVTSIWLDQAEVHVTEGDEFVLTATVKPDNATDPTVTWSSSNPSVATVTDGRVKALKEGVATIFATAGEKRAQCVVDVQAFVPVNELRLDKASLELTVGQQELLTATVGPSYATDKTVTWLSSDVSIATVEDGLVTAVGAGEAYIYARAGELTVQCSVLVKDDSIPVTSITLNVTSVSLEEGEEFQLVATVLPENATDKTVTWRSTDESIATVTDGLVKGIKEGTAVIVAKAGNKDIAIVVVVRKPFIHVTSVALDKHTLEMTVGDEYTLTATILPENASNPAINWVSSEMDVATVEDGKVTALMAGETTITAQVEDKEDKCVITVKKGFVPVSGVTLDQSSLALVVGGTATLTATVEPEDATDKTVTWTSSNAAVATVADGVVTGVKAGTATITAKAGDKTAKCTVTVAKKPVINLPQTSMETGGFVDIPGSFSYSISNPVSGETLQAYSDESWIEITGITSTEVKFKTKAPCAIERTGTIHLVYKDADPKDFTILQHDQNYDWTKITVTPTSVSVPAAGNTVTVSYTIENPVEGYGMGTRLIPYNCDWITSVKVNPTSSSAGTVTFTVAENATQQSREAKVTILNQAAIFVKNVAVTQAGQPAGPPELEIVGRDPGTTYGLSPYGEEECIVAYVINPVEGVEVQMSADVSWISNFRHDGNYHYFTAAPNFTGATRYANVTLTYGSVSKTVKFQQYSEEPEIVLTPNNVTFDYHARNVSFEVSLPDGCDYNQLKLETYTSSSVKNIQRNGKKVTFELRENNDGYDRNLEIEVSYGSAKAIFQITQTYTAPVFHVYPSTSFTVGYAAGDYPIDVQVDNARELELSLMNLDHPGWITCRSEDGVPTFHVYENKTGANRSARARVWYGNNTLGYVDVTVTQTTASTSISVDPAKIECGAAGTTKTLTFTITDPLSGVNMTATAASPWIQVSNVSNTSATVKVIKNLANKSRSSSITFNYGSYSVLVPVTQEANNVPDGFVDLGLPSGTLWAEANVGAASDYEAGSFFAWAEKTPKSTFSWNNYLWGTASNLTKYNSTDRKTLVELADDAAYQANSAWVLPTKAQLEELTNYCDKEWVNDPPYFGMRFKARNGDTSIFLPAAGHIQTWADGEWAGYYWSRTLYTSDRTKAYYLIIMESADLVQTEQRFVGMTARAIKK